MVLTTGWRRRQNRPDQALVDRAVRHINDLHRKKALELVVALGEYLLEEFFGDDPERLRAARTHASWRALAGRDDLDVSYSQLWYSVAIVAQLRQLPAGVGRALSVSQHRRLVSVSDADAKRRLAVMAVRERLTVKQLEAAISKEREKERSESRARGGRPALPAHIKALRRLPNLVEPLTDTAVSADDVALIGVGQMSTLMDQLEEQIDTLSRAREEMAVALEEFRGAGSQA